MVSLRSYQEELKRLVFIREKEPQSSFLWKEGLPPRLEVYRNNARSNWSDALDCDFVLTRGQFSEEDWYQLKQRFFIQHPPSHWELNQSLIAFPTFLAKQKVRPYIKELADYEWHDLKIFIDRTPVLPGSGVTNPTAVVRVYQHQIFYWVEQSAPSQKPPIARPEVLVFYRDSQNVSNVREADPLMLLMMEHFRKPGAPLADLEAVRAELLPQNRVSLEAVLEDLSKKEIILI